MPTISVVAQSPDRLADLYDAMPRDIAADYLQIDDLPHCSVHETAILDVDLVNCDEVRTIKAWLSRRPQSGRVIVCIDDAASHHQVTQAFALGATAVVERPLTAARLRDMLQSCELAIEHKPDPNDAQADLKAIGDIFADARAGRSPNMARVSQAGAQIVERIQQTGLSGYLDAIRSHHSRTYTHCLTVTAIATSFGLQLGFGRRDQERLAIAGLLHDIGKSQINIEILEKPTALSARERAIVKTHPILGYDILRGSSGLADDIRDMVLHHHEYLDGTGYPHGLRGARISDLTRMLTIADVFGALIEPRSYKPPMSALAALGVLHDLGPKLDQTLVRVFAPVAHKLAA